MLLLPYNDSNSARAAITFVDSMTFQIVPPRPIRIKHLNLRVFITTSLSFLRQNCTKPNPKHL